jgi:hypothetical protein
MSAARGPSLGTEEGRNFHTSTVWGSGGTKGVGFLYRGELLLRRKEIIRRRFLRIGQNHQRLRHEKTDDEFQRAKPLPAVAWPIFKYRRSAKIPKRKIFPLFWIAFLEILI